MSGCLVLIAALLALPGLLPDAASGQQITEIVQGYGLDNPSALATDSQGNVYVAVEDRDTVLKVSAAGAFTEIIDATGDGSGNVLSGPTALAVDPAGNVYVSGQLSRNVLRIDSSTGSITQVLDESGDGAGHELDEPCGLTSGAAGDLFASTADGNVFRIAPDGTITLLAALREVDDQVVYVCPIAVDTDNNVYVAGSGIAGATLFVISSSAPVQVIPLGTQLSEIETVAVNSDGNPIVSSLWAGTFEVVPGAIPQVTKISDEGGLMALDSHDNIYVSGLLESTVKRITPSDPPSIVTIINGYGDGAGNYLGPVVALTVSHDDNVYVAGRSAFEYLPTPLSNIFRITPALEITEIIDSPAVGGQKLDRPAALAVGSEGAVYVTGGSSSNVLKITAEDVVEIIDGNVSGPFQITALAADSDGNAYVAVCYTFMIEDHRVIRVSADGEMTDLIDQSGDGQGNPLLCPSALAVDADQNVYVAGGESNNAFKITPSGTITELIDELGDGEGGSLSSPRGIAVDVEGNVYVAGESNNVFRIAPDLEITEIIDESGDGEGHALQVCGVADDAPIAVDPDRNVYVASCGPPRHGVFKVGPTGLITRIMDGGDCAGNELRGPSNIAVDAGGYVYVGGASTNNAFQITPEGAVNQIIDAAGDGAGNSLRAQGIMTGVAVDESGAKVYVSGSFTDNVFEIEMGVLDPVCGDCVVNQPAEQCDGGDDSGCPGSCQSDCTCGTVVDSDGDGIPDHQECGDISGDGFVNTIDARLIQRCAVGEDLSEICGNTLCDATGEGECNTIDARLVQRFAVGELSKDDLHCAAKDGTPLETAGAACGLGFEQALLLPLLMWLSRRRRRVTG